VLFTFTKDSRAFGRKIPVIEVLICFHSMRKVVIWDRNMPVAKLVPFTAEDASEGELALVAAGAMRLPEKPLDLDQLWKIPRATVRECRDASSSGRETKAGKSLSGIPPL
jgi:hypothetical protein